MQDKKVNLKKVNKTNNSTVRTLDCHCKCEGKAVKAFSNGYIGVFLSAALWTVANDKNICRLL